MWTQRPSDCAAGDELLSRGAWSEARAAFEAMLRERETPEALEGLGLAAWWLDDADAVFDSRKRAYRLYSERGDRASAGRVAVWLAWDTWAFRGEHAVSNGWLQRARSLLAGLPDCPEQAWLEIREGSLCLVEDGDRGLPHAVRVDLHVARHLARGGTGVDDRGRRALREPPGDDAGRDRPSRGAAAPPGTAHRSRVALRAGRLARARVPRPRRARLRSRRHARGRGAHRSIPAPRADAESHRSRGGSRAARARPRCRGQPGWSENRARGAHRHRGDGDDGSAE